MIHSFILQNSQQGKGKGLSSHQIRIFLFRKDKDMKNNWIVG
jgi:hypothetical protein